MTIHRRTGLKRVLGVASVVVVIAASALGTRASGSPAIPYAEGQARLGAELYQKQQCALCHGDQLQGVRQSPPLRGASFLSRYTDQPALMIFAKIQKTMPATDPGSLTRPQVAALVAYLLSRNHYAAGPIVFPEDDESLKAAVLPRPQTP